VETVGGLMAKQLNKVPIAGSVVKYDGLVSGGRALQWSPEQDRT
jgi:CBS domain containing-hemolysin-like protein